MKKTILIVEDRDDARKMIKTALEKVGYSVLEAENGEEAWKLIQTRPLPIMITDIHMPNMDGKQLLQKIKGDKKYKKLKIIMLTASKVYDTEKREYIDLGADEILTKPISITSLREKVKKLIG